MIKYFDMNDSKQRYTVYFFFAAVVLVASYILLYKSLGQSLLSHSVYDSYTRQAAAWWQGRVSLPENISWLEIAEYGGEYFISFPSFPSVIQFLLYPLFGMNTPDNLINTLFALGAFVLIYRFCMRQGFNSSSASIIALLMTLGSNLFYISVVGWVWFSAQTQSFFFSVLCLYLIYNKKEIAWYFAFLSLGIAFACRPFQIVYFPLVLYILWQQAKRNHDIIKTSVRCIKYVFPLVFVGLCTAAYNYIRFDSLFEFGHNYLPEFTNELQFSLGYVPGNFMEILKLPSFHNGAVEWPKFNGTLFFLVNPVFILLGVSMIRQRFGTKQMIYAICLVLHFVLTLSHKTMGGWQFGSRYLVDMIPFMLIIFADDIRFKESRKPKNLLPIALVVLGMVINVSGALWFFHSV